MTARAQVDGAEHGVDVAGVRRRSIVGRHDRQRSRRGGSGRGPPCSCSPTGVGGRSDHMPVLVVATIGLSGWAQGGPERPSRTVSGVAPGGGGGDDHRRRIVVVVGPSTWQRSRPCASTAARSRGEHRVEQALLAVLDGPVDERVGLHQRRRHGLGADVDRAGSAREAGDPGGSARRSWRPRRSRRFCAGVRHQSVQHWPFFYDTTGVERRQVLGTNIEIEASSWICLRYLDQTDHHHYC